MTTLYDRVHMLSTINVIKFLLETRRTLLQRKINQRSLNVNTTTISPWHNIAWRDPQLLNLYVYARYTHGLSVPELIRDSQ